MKSPVLAKVLKEGERVCDNPFWFIDRVPNTS